MRRSAVLTVVSLYLLVCTGALIAFAHHVMGARPPAWIAGVCLALLPLYWGWSAREPSLQQFYAKASVFFGFVPILMILWATGFEAPQAEDALPPAPLAATAAADQVPTLDADATFAGALAVQDVPLAPPVRLARAAAFADGTELRLTRYTDAGAARAHAEFLAGAQGAVPASLEGRKGMRMTSASPRFVYVELHGVDEVQVSAQDAEQALARLTAQRIAVPGGAPIAIPVAQAVGAQQAAAAVDTRALWPVGVGAALAHVVAFVLFVLWCGTRGTRVAAVSGASPVSEDTLRARLVSLRTDGAPLRVEPGDGPDELRVSYVFPEGELRARTLLLRIDAARRVVIAREREGILGDAPKDAREADMRPIGSVGIDPTRPNAQQVWNRSAVSSILEPTALAAVPIVPDATRAHLAPDYAQALQPDTMALLCCAVVTRSGYVWQPSFWGK